jgi:hypothetical protein
MFNAELRLTLLVHRQRPQRGNEQTNYALAAHEIVGLILFVHAAYQF